MSEVALSVVVPVFNEGPILQALVSRLEAALRDPALGAEGPTELILVDDASTDGSGDALAALQAEGRLAHLRLPRNRGQWGATRAGLQAARGRCVAVLDGDLQDPPELLPQVFAALRGRPDLEVAFAVKASRDDPAWFLLGHRVFSLAQAALGAAAPPRGAGSYCVMRRPLAQAVARVPLRQANLAALVAAARARGATVPYDKAARYDERSRVGPWGLAREAVGSMLVTGALERLALAAGVTALLTGAATTPVAPPLGLGLALGGLALTGTGLALRHRRSALRAALVR